ncbi:MULTISPECIES: Dyp-type peroxidase [Brevibacterium]|uniref:Dyp-type peroxidase n=1 Tax=Brevibacterium salitolerans TaxID=1403566 RepID=A0ABP5IJ86_9MICO|nr:Dyp-type peroxidase [Brevibacterium sp.]
MSALSRRRVLAGGAAAGAGGLLLTGCTGDGRTRGTGASAALSPAEALRDAPVGGDTVPFHGAHQAGVSTEPQAFASFLALDLDPEAGTEEIRRLLWVLTDDAVRLTQGRGALADTEPELAVSPARLTVTFGFGPEFVRRAAGETAVPAWLKPLPEFGIDRLEERWSGGDLLLQVGCDDQVTLAHAARVLLKNSRAWTSLRWRQSGFRRSRGAEKPGTTMRNLFGQVDGTVNPRPDDEDFASTVWAEDGWMAGGTSLVLRRIRMDLDEWDRVDRSARDSALGRRQSDGAPLTGEDEFDPPDFQAEGSNGFPVIPEFSHVARANGGDARPTMLRRSYNYEEDSGDDAGLLFAAYQRDPDTGFVPVQRRLDELDILNQWTTPVGSAVFAIPPGCEEGGFVGETLF